MKSKNSLAITLIVLTAVSIVCFVGGAFALAAGGVKAISDSELPEQFANLDFDLETVFEYIEPFIDEDNISYNSDYDVDTQSFDENIYDAVIIEDVPYDIVVTFSGTGGKVGYEGKYPSLIAKEELLQVEENGDELIISVKSIFGQNRGGMGTLTVCLSNSFEGELIIRDCSGNIEMTHLSLNKLTIDSVAGEVKSEEVYIKELCIQDTVGDIELDGEFESYDIDSCLGDIEIESDIAPLDNSIISDCLGDIEITFPKGTVLDVMREGNLAKIEVNVDDVNSGMQFEITDCLGRICLDYN